ncbi:MAG: hypothetical protein BroJett011_40160 [Chloroflexota bacterium]|nr:MAG: hypothetical protein BroJett011_40160 [Chloroflexota bacterium]
MKLTCKQCGTSIPSPAEDQAWARCANCQAVFSLSWAEIPTDLAQAGAFLPKGMSLQLLPNGLEIAYNWFSPVYIVLALIALIWNSFIFSAIGALGWWLLLIPHFWVGIGMAAYALINLVNRTIITVTPDDLEIIHTPIPYPPYRIFDPITLKQLYVKEVKHQNKGSVTYTYDLYMTTWTGRNQKLVGRIPEAHIALALEKEIEHFLQIKDRAIPGEFRWLSDSERKELRQAWQALAAATSLKFNPETASEKATVSGVYRGYYLHLDVVYRSHNRTKYTQLLLTPESPPDYNYPFLSDEARLGQPLTEAEVLSVLAAGGFPHDENEQIDVSANAQKIYFEQAGLETDPHFLHQACDAMVHLARGYAKLQTIGGEAIPALEALAAQPRHGLNSIVRQLIQDIAADTTTRLGHQPDSFYCRRCLTRCAAHTGQVTLIKTFTYYGCRTCRQSRALLEWTGPVVAVLDSRMAEQWVEQAGTVRVNWLLQRSLFDFEAVEIVQASDEEIERFAVQVGNDTDPLRQPDYELMACRIGLSCHLSDNSLRVLHSIFGSVERGPLLADVAETAVNDQERESGDQDQDQGHLFL